MKGLSVRLYNFKLRKANFTLLAFCLTLDCCRSKSSLFNIIKRAQRFLNSSQIFGIRNDSDKTFMKCSCRLSLLLEHETKDLTFTMTRISVFCRIGEAFIWT